MAVRRIVANISAEDVPAASAFYRDVLGLDVVMDMGWIVTFAAAGTAMTPQVSVMRGGGSGTPVPDISIEVDDVDTMLARCRKAGWQPSYGPVDEPWGVRRFYVEDPLGRLVNIVQHIERAESASGS